MKITALFVILFFSTLAFASGDTTSAWKKDGVAGINISQISLDNWSQGGEDALSWTFFTNMSFDYLSNNWLLKNKFKLAYGRTKLGDADYRTNDNEIYLETVLSYSLGWAVDPYFSNTIRSSVSSGFDYKKTPYLKTADFFDPGYVSQSLGFTYQKMANFNFRLGFGFQETFTSEQTFYADDPSTAEVEKFKLETGIESVSEGKYSFEENLLFTSKLRLFSTFKEIDVWDVRWDNTLTAKVSKYVNVNLNILVIYEKKQTPKTQLKEALQLGIVYNLF
ncbi:MAG: DUF3078 domain-containing protein [Ignavibacteriaceae bacterium]|nr:DUF3078 domain-containing protein [Ignavibacteriaceae bacterium]